MSPPKGACICTSIHLPLLTDAPSFCAARSVDDTTALLGCSRHFHTGISAFWPACLAKPGFLFIPIQESPVYLRSCDTLPTISLFGLLPTYFEAFFPLVLVIFPIAPLALSHSVTPSRGGNITPRLMGQVDPDSFPKSLPTFVSTLKVVRDEQPGPSPGIHM